jgi:saccharopine dehydrogenase (NADP+, L-glutamate forming)
MKKIAILGSGFVSKPAVDYFLNRCGYEVVVSSLKKSEAEKIIGGRPGGRAVAWSQEQHTLLDNLVSEVDLVMSLIPPTMHLPVAEACLKHRKNMVTTSYLSPPLEALGEKAHNLDILILNEIGEDPGLDNMRTKQMIDEVKTQGGKVKSITSYGAGLPSFEDNTNPFGYKFSWSPRGVIMAARTPAAYLLNGRKIEVPAEDLFKAHHPVVLGGGVEFETYPNRDCTRYLKCFELDRNISFFRGILRYKGWCKTMSSLADLHYFDTCHEKDFAGQTYAEFTAWLLGETCAENIVEKTADFLNCSSSSDLIYRLNWLGLFDDRPIAIQQGTNADLLIDLMMDKMSYSEGEKDMVIVHAEVVADFANCREKRLSTLLVHGQPGGDSAMSRAVSLPAAIAAKLILQGKIMVKGVQRPTFPEIYRPVLKEMEGFGYTFVNKTLECQLPG